MCAATPTLIDPSGLSCGPLVGCRHPGLEQRCPARLARRSFVGCEKSSRIRNFIMQPRLRPLIVDRRERSFTARWLAAAECSEVRRTALQFTRVKKLLVVSLGILATACGTPAQTKPQTENHEAEATPSATEVFHLRSECAAAALGRRVRTLRDAKGRS